MKKNVSGQKIGAQMITAADGSAFTGSVTVYVTGDAGTQAAGSVGSGACTHEGNGYHTYAPAQAETNYDLVAFTFTGTGAIPATVQVFTNFPQTGDNYARIGAPVGASISADIAAVQADTDNIQTRLPAALVSGRMDASVGAMANNVLTASAIASDAITDAKVASDVTIASVTGSVGSIATGGITSASFAAGAIDNAAIAADAIGSSELAASAVTEIQSGLSTLTTADVAGAVWNAATASYGSAGSYGLLVETNLDAAVTTRLASASYTAPLDAAGVRTAVGLASANLDTQLAAIDTETDKIASIKAKTDNLTYTVANQVDVNIQSINDVTIIGDGSGTPFNV